MAGPADFDAVIASLKLGWYVAEVRGRNRVDTNAPTPPEVAVADDDGTTLLLRAERPARQRRAEAQQVLEHLARSADLNVDADPAQGGASRTAAIGAASDALAAVAGGDDAARGVAWKKFATAICDFDAAVQKSFSEGSETQESAYQLGRALAEAYWALDAKQKVPDSPAAAGPANWAFLLGVERCREIERLLGRLGPYFDQYTAPAVAGSVRVWQMVAATPGWRDQQSAATDLYNQIRRWYDLLVLGQDPTTLIKPFGVLRNLRATWRSVRAFAPQLLIGAVSVVALLGFVQVTNSGFGTAVGSVIGGLGLSFSALTAKAKSSAQALTTRLREDAYSDLITVSITIVPARTDRDRDSNSKLDLTSSTRRSVTAALGNRTLTTAVSA